LAKEAKVRQKRPPSVDLDTKSPLQDRSRSTFEAVLAATGELMRDVGFERLSTNMIAERAGLTPPALYRYFPNKYAVLKELAERLMQAQDDVVFEWIANGGMDGEPDERIAKTIWVYGRVVDVTRAQPGGVFVNRVMRVTPVLRQVRVDSRELVVRNVMERLRLRYPTVPEARLETAARLTTEAGTAAIEIAVEEPDLADDILAEAARMVVLYYEGLTAY